MIRETSDPDGVEGENGETGEIITGNKQDEDGV